MTAVHSKAVGSSPHRLTRLFEPRRIAVVGASPKGGMGAHLIGNLRSHGYTGEVVPVNPKYDEIDGQVCYHSVSEIPNEVDVAVLLVPADGVAAALRDCVTAGAASAIIMAAGFAEDARGRGKARQAEVDEALQGSDLVVLGPNSEGFINLCSGTALSLSHSVNADFLRQTATWLPPGAPDVAAELRGGVAIIAQSGGLGFSVFSRGVAAGVAFSHVISLGNEIDVDVLECAEYLLGIPEVKVIGMYVEGLGRPERLTAVAAAARRAGKALVIGKAGTSEAGRAATLSHTGHLAGEAPVYDAVFRRHGILQAYDQEELLDICAAVATSDPVLGDNVAIVSWSGGSAVWTSDALDRAGFELPELDQERRDALAEVLPPFANIRNPVDITGASNVGLAKVMRTVASAPYLDALVLITTLNSGWSMEKDGAELASLVAEATKPIIVYTYTEPLPENRKAYRDLGLPLYPSSNRSVRALKALRQLGAAHAAGEPRTFEDLPDSSSSERRVLTERETSELLAAAGFPTAQQHLATTADEAVVAAAKIGYPVALKLQAPSIPHKAAAGGVLLSLVGDDAVRAGAQQLLVEVATGVPDVEGVLVQEMVPPGLEMLVGVDNTAGFGPIMMVGFGGSQVEALRDVAMECAPLSPEQASALIDSLRGAAILDGERYGHVHYDRAGLVDLLVRLSEWAVEHAAGLRELDVNPVVVRADGVTILDSLLVVGSEYRV